MDNDAIIPVIDLGNEDRKKVSETLRAACIDVGFFYLQGHGLETESVLAESRKLFALSIESKRAMSDHVMSRGYTAMEEETLDPPVQTRGDTKEGFYIGLDIPEADPRYNPKKLSGPNQWPSRETTADMENPERFRAVMESYYSNISNVGLQVVRLLALAIGVEESYFDAAFEKPLATLRLLHYAAVKSKPDEGVFACGAHSDYGMLTLLLTDENPGLQILTNNNEWIEVPYRQGSFVVNLGDMLDRWTNGLFRSTKHRVITKGDQERYSIPFFYDPNFDTVVECIPVCCSPGNPARFGPITSGQHLLDKYSQTHADYKPAT